MKKALPGTERYLHRFEHLDRERFKKEPDTIRELRRAAIARFSDLGFPSTRLEDWKYTNVAPIAKMQFELETDGRNGVSRKKVRSYELDEACQIVFVNGRFAPEFSSTKGLPDGIEIRSLAEAMENSPEKVEPHLGRYASFEQNAFVALNTAFLSDGVFLYVPPETIVETVIHVVFLTTTQMDGTVSHLRNLIVVDDNSEATVVERYASLGGKVYFNNVVTEVVAGANAVVDHYKLQQESEEAFHIATIQSEQKADSNLTSHNISLGGNLSRNDVNAVLDGEGGDLHLNGFYLLGGRQHLDNHTRIRHAKPHCTSLEIYKGILDDHAHGVFNGIIFVEQGAQKTNAIQTNRNLLLSEDCLANSNPQLEIYADDVKCTHGSTIGQLDEDSIFYLRSRGLSYEAARALLINAYASEVLDPIKIRSIREELRAVLSDRLHFGQVLVEAPSLTAGAD